MINFTVGPVNMDASTLEVGYKQLPYFRTPAFSSIMFESERLILNLCKAPCDSRACFMTCSGTGSMEAAVINVLDNKDKVLVINGGTFGHRFSELCKMHNLDYDEIIVEAGCSLEERDLLKYDNNSYTALLVNVHETSTGVLYDMEMISNFCKKNNIILIADIISSFLADPFDMKKLNVDVAIIGSQKALACPPGVSIIVLSARAIERVNKHDCGCMYLDLKKALLDGKRGQTPFTCAVGTLLQINYKLKTIDNNGGVESEIKRISELASYFRSKLSKYPLGFFSKRMSNAVTSLYSTKGKSAFEICTILRDEYNIWVCPNGGDMKDKVFRVGHLGALSTKDYDSLFAAFDDMKARQLL